jgi:excisionase family DNA binding protein
VRSQKDLQGSYEPNPHRAVAAMISRRNAQANSRTNSLLTDDARQQLPRLLTPDEVAASLRTSRKAVYAMVERAQIPVIRIGRRVLVRERDLIEWLGQKLTPSLER